MTDDSAPVTLGEIRAGRSLAERVAALEAAQGTAVQATLEHTDDGILAPLTERIDRHRQELDELKRRYNALARYVQQQLTGDVPPEAGQ